MMKLSFFFITIFFLIAACMNILDAKSLVSTIDDSNGVKVAKFQRLPTNVIPKKYALTLEPDLEKFTFTGIEDVSVEVKEATDKIILNAKDLQIDEILYKFQNGSEIEPKNFTISVKDEHLIIFFHNKLQPGHGTLHISYKGTLNDKLKGFYRAKYPSVDGKSPDRYVATTQFESTYARYAFPSWDEPLFKATFKIALIAPNGHEALSNMPVEHEKDLGNSKRLVTFQESKIMSTYLVAFIVGQFDHVEMINKHDIRVRVYTSPGKGKQGEAALKVAAKALDFYSDYFNIPYPLPKMDLVSISDFQAGAMENWGLNVFKETSILVDPEITSSSVEQQVGIIVAHEIAHQWFGNLVTMEWWTHLWLNEGFASFMEYLSIDKLEPEKLLWRQFVSREYSAALSLDALHNSHPIEVEINNPSEIDEIFDTISYNKGASVIRMLYEYIGDEAFAKGMNEYLNKFKYSNAKTEDLWNALEHASGQPVNKIMTPWTKQKGYPVIHVTGVIGNLVLKLSQKKFSSDGIINDDEDYLWQVPISIITSDSREKPLINTFMSEKSIKVTVPNGDGARWIKLNPGSVGLYRVAYEDGMLLNLIEAINSKELPPLDRLNILDDLSALVKSGEKGTWTLLRALDATKDEDDSHVWSSITGTISSLNSLLSSTNFQGKFNQWALSLLTNIKAKVGWDAKDGESYDETTLRVDILQTLATLNDNDTLEKSKKLFNENLNEGTPIPANLKQLVYYSIAKQADEKVFNILLELHRKAEFPEEKSKIATSLGFVPDAKLIQKVLDVSISDEVRSQDTISIIASAGANKAGRDLTWEFFKKNFALFKDRYASTLIASHIPSAVAGNFADEQKVKEVEEFFTKNPIPGSEMAVKQLIEALRIRSKWLERDGQSISDYLKRK